MSAGRGGGASEGPQSLAVPAALGAGQDAVEHLENLRGRRLTWRRVGVGVRTVRLASTGWRLYRGGGSGESSGTWWPNIQLLQ